MPTSWQSEVSDCLSRGALGEARTVLDRAVTLLAADPEPWQALAEVAAGQDDFSNCRIALARYLHAAETITGAPCQQVEPKWLVQDDVRLKLHQQWLSHQPRSRAARQSILQSLRRFPWFVPPPLAKETDEVILERVAPRLAAYETEFAQFGGELSLWRDLPQLADIQTFRGEFCVSQAASHEPSNFGPARLLGAYTLALEYAFSCDRLRALKTFEDDGAFGGLRFSVDGRCTSFDVIDSCLQLNFIARHCGFDPAEPIHLLDIGAGWGRLVHRFLELFPRGRALALDVVPFASFCAERYLDYRGVLDRGLVGSRNQLRSVAPGDIDIATNVHSWSEAPLDSIMLWIEAIEALRVPFLFFVAHGLPAGSFEQSGPSRLIVPEILGRGWDIVVDAPKYGASIHRQRFGLYPTAHYFLFGKSYVS